MLDAYKFGCVTALAKLGLEKHAEPTTFSRWSGKAQKALGSAIPKSKMGRLAALGLLGTGAASLYNNQRNNSSVAPMPIPYAAPQNPANYYPQR